MRRLIRHPIGVKPVFSLLFVLALLNGQAAAKHLVYAEYFFDTDPGKEHGTAITPCDGVFDEPQEEFCVTGIPTPSLADGRHTLFLRLKDSENNWGMRRMDFFVVSSSPYAQKTITAAEYRIDAGSWAPLPALDGQFDKAIELLRADGVESAALSLGPHTLFVRAKDSYNVWSVERQFRFNVIDSNPYKQLVAAEYFIDVVGAEGSGTPLPPSDGSWGGSKEAVEKSGLASASLSPGSHTAYVRFRDNWSHWPQFSGWGPVRNGAFCVVEIPALIYPPNDATSSNDSLRWNVLQSVAGYDIYLTDSVAYRDSFFVAPPSVNCFDFGSVPNLPESDRWYWWRMRARYECGLGPWCQPRRFYREGTGILEDDEYTGAPGEYALTQNYPNPFNPTTAIRFALPNAANVYLHIYDLLGRKVATLIDGKLEAGEHIIHWDGKGSDGQPLASGIYFYRLTAGEFVEAKKMVLMK